MDCRKQVIQAVSEFLSESWGVSRSMHHGDFNPLDIAARSGVASHWRVLVPARRHSDRCILANRPAAGGCMGAVTRSSALSWTRMRDCQPAVSVDKKVRYWTVSINHRLAATLTRNRKFEAEPWQLDSTRLGFARLGWRRRCGSISKNSCRQAIMAIWVGSPSGEHKEAIPRHYGRTPRA